MGSYDLHAINGASILPTLQSAPVGFLQIIRQPAHLPTAERVHNHNVR